MRYLFPLWSFFVFPAAFLIVKLRLGEYLNETIELSLLVACPFMRCNEEGVGRSHPNNDSFAGRSITALPVSGS